MTKIDKNPESASASVEITPDDLKMAEDMEKEGKPVPPDLKAAYDAFKASKGGNPDASQGAAKKDDEDPTKKAAETDPQRQEDPQKPADQPDPKVFKDDEGKNGGDVAPPVPRGVKTVPLAKYLDAENQNKTLAQKVTELEKQLTDLPKKSDEDYEKEIEALAADVGLSVDEIKKLDGFFAKHHQLPPEVLESVKQAQDAKKQESYWNEQFQKYDGEFIKDVATLKESDATEAALMEKHAEAIKELAFTEGYNHKSPWEIWTRFVKPNLDPERKTIEAPSGSGGAGAAAQRKDWATISKDPAKIRQISKEDWPEYEKWLEAQDGSNLRRAKRL